MYGWINRILDVVINKQIDKLAVMPYTTFKCFNNAIVIETSINRGNNCLYMCASK